MKKLFLLLSVLFLFNGAIISQKFNRYNSFGQKEGIWISIPDSLSIFSYGRIIVNRIGFWTNLGYDSTDSRQIVLYETFVNGKREGPFKGELLDSTLVLCGSYHDNLLEGFYYKFKKDGELYVVDNRHNGTLQGKSITYYEGNPWQEYTYEKGILKEEIWYEYLYYGGKKDLTFTYKKVAYPYDEMGRPKNGKIFSYRPDGRIFMVSVFRNHKEYRSYFVSFDFERGRYDGLDDIYSSARDLWYPWWWPQY
jgi:antitoxin component YwqK of YwqJK toxin-antitoxin module